MSTLLNTFLHQVDQMQAVSGGGGGGATSVGDVSDNTSIGTISINS